MYTQNSETKKRSFAAAFIIILLIILLTVGTYVCAAVFVPNTNPTALSAAILLVLMLLFYFLTKAGFSSYTYTFDGKSLEIKQLTGKRCIKNIVIDKKDITQIKKGSFGVRLFPYGTVPHTIVTDKKSFSVAIDSSMLAYLTTPCYTDAYIDNNFDSLIEKLKELIAIPSVKEAPLADMPFGKPCADALKYTLELCASLGMETKNVDNYCGWAEVGSGEKLIGILCHLDVVPVGDGWNTDPFCALVTDKEIFGRGAIDDKGPGVAAIYAVAAAKEALGDLSVRVRLIFGCDEESGWGCMDRYALTEEAPHIAFTPDAEYPVIITEKGIACFTINTSLEEGDYQLYLSGGLRHNMVPDKAHATVIGDMDRLANVLSSFDAQKHGISYSVSGNKLEIDSVGVGAHGSTPEIGVNAFFELFKLLDMLDLKSSQGKFVKDMLSVFVDKIDGSGANLKLEDEASGKLSLNLGMCFIGKNTTFEDMADDSCRIVIDIRYPISYDIKDISARLQSALPDSWECEILHAQAPHHVSEDSLLVQTLLSVYKEYTKRDDKPIAIGGGTYARSLPNRAVAFGIQFLDKPNTAHQPNEFVELEDLRISAKMFATAIVRLIENV